MSFIIPMASPIKRPANPLSEKFRESGDDPQLMVTIRTATEWLEALKYRGADADAPSESSSPIDTSHTPQELVSNQVLQFAHDSSADSNPCHTRPLGLIQANPTSSSFSTVPWSMSLGTQDLSSDQAKPAQRVARSRTLRTAQHPYSRNADTASEKPQITCTMQEGCDEIVEGIEMFKEHLHHKHGVSKGHANALSQPCPWKGCGKATRQCSLMKHIVRKHSNVKVKCALCAFTKTFLHEVQTHYIKTHDASLPADDSWYREVRVRRA